LGQEPIIADQKITDQQLPLNSSRQDAAVVEVAQFVVGEVAQFYCR
jgi:hypothetical protein